MRELKSSLNRILILSIKVAEKKWLRYYSTYLGIHFHLSLSMLDSLLSCTNTSSKFIYLNITYREMGLDLVKMLEHEFNELYE